MFPLSVKQKTIWGLRWKGSSAGEIANELGTSRQYVHQVLIAAESKVSRTLMDVAQSASLQIKKIDPKNGVLLAYDPILKSNSVITYTNKNGIRIWHWFDRIEDIKDQSYADEVRSYLLNEADERRIKLTGEERNLHPARLARLIFGRLIQELE
jgi:transcriptional regulator